MADMQAAEEAIIKTKQEAFLTAKPSEMILMALEDLEVIEKTPERFRVNMDTWMDWRYDLKEDGIRCYVCLAGAVMANRFKIDNLERSSFAVTKQYDALDHFRRGAVGNGLRALNIYHYNIRDIITVIPYSSNPKMFKHDVRQVAAELNKVGL